MVDYLKSKLLEHPEKIGELLEHYGYCHIKIRSTYISFGRDEQSSPKSIMCKLVDSLICKDYARNITLDIFNLIIKQRSVSFKDVITATKNILGIDYTYYQEQRQKAVFNGFYSRIRKRDKVELKVYDESILDKYEKCGNLRFVKDGISLDVQREFDIGYDIESQSITIPIYDEIGRLIGVKCRRNCDDCEMKYWYDVPCLCSQTLYGYCQNYQWLESSEIIYVVESEKTVMAAKSFKYNNFLALGSGSISKKQVQLLLSLRPKKIVLMHDTGFDKEAFKRNLSAIQGYSRMIDVDIGYWNYFGQGYEDKLAPTDKGKEFFENAIHNEIKWLERKVECEKDEDTSRTS